MPRCLQVILYLKQSLTPDLYRDIPESFVLLLRFFRVQIIRLISDGNVCKSEFSLCPIVARSTCNTVPHERAAPASIVAFTLDYTSTTWFAIQVNVPGDEVGLHRPPSLNGKLQTEISTRDSFDVLGRCCIGLLCV